MTNSLSATLGEKIKSTRLERRITLEEVAKQTNLTPSFLSQIERNIASPSVESLRKIALALGTKVSSFFEENETKGIVLFKKKHNLNIQKNFRVQTIRLINEVYNTGIHPFIIILNTTKGEKDLPAYNDEEFGMVLLGKILVSMDGTSHILDEGDCIYLTSPKKHKIVNIGSSMAEVLWIYSSKF